MNIQCQKKYIYSPGSGVGSAMIQTSTNTHTTNNETEASDEANESSVPSQANSPRSITGACTAQAGGGVAKTKTMEDDRMNNMTDEWGEENIAWGTVIHAISIFDKYINKQSLFKINISSVMRKELISKFTKFKAKFQDDNVKIAELIVGVSIVNDNGNG